MIRRPPEFQPPPTNELKSVLYQTTQKTFADPGTELNGHHQAVPGKQRKYTSYMISALSTNHIFYYYNSQPPSRMNSAISSCWRCTMFIASSVLYTEYQPGDSCGGSPAHKSPN
jgi:hypothetical protein